jgi:hypothetical protein
MPAGAIQSVKPIIDGLVEVTTNPCCVCGSTHEFVLDEIKFNNWQEGVYIQNAFPDLTPADREILISGTCDECFHELFPPED